MVAPDWLDPRRWLHTACNKLSFTAPDDFTYSLANASVLPASTARARIEHDAQDCGLAVFFDPAFTRPTAASRAAAPPSSTEFLMSLEESQICWDTGAAAFHSIISLHTTADHDDFGSCDQPRDLPEIC